jgi:predicted transposase YdaD
MVTTLYNPIVAEKAKRKGREEDGKDVAMKMLEEKVDVKLIEKFTGLKSEEILKLKEEIEK